MAREQGVANIQFTADALARLSSYAWPGNVRELRNKIYACTALAETRIVDCEGLLRFCHFDEGFGEDRQQELPMEELSGATLAQIERRAILRAIRVANGDTAEAARKLGVSRRKLQYRLKEYKGDSVESPQ